MTADERLSQINKKILLDLKEKGVISEVMETKEFKKMEELFSTYPAKKIGLLPVMQKQILQGYTQYNRDPKDSEIKDYLISFTTLFSSLLNSQKCSDVQFEEEQTPFHPQPINPLFTSPTPVPMQTEPPPAPEPSKPLITKPTLPTHPPPLFVIEHKKNAQTLKKSLNTPFIPFTQNKLLEPYNSNIQMNLKNQSVNNEEEKVHTSDCSPIMQFPSSNIDDDFMQNLLARKPKFGNDRDELFNIASITKLEKRRKNERPASRLKNESVAYQSRNISKSLVKYLLKFYSEVPNCVQVADYPVELVLEGREIMERFVDYFKPREVGEYRRFDFKTNLDALFQKAETNDFLRHILMRGIEERVRQMSDEKFEKKISKANRSLYRHVYTQYLDKLKHYETNKVLSNIKLEF
jgi:hypothetical protein